MTEAPVSNHNKFLSRQEIGWWITVIGMVIAMAASFYHQTARIEVLTEKVERLEDQVQQLQNTYQDCQVRLVRIEVDLNYIRDWIEKQEKKENAFSQGDYTAPASWQGYTAALY